MKPLLVVQHVPWERPHRILDAFADVPTIVLESLADVRPLPSVQEVCGAVVMGGPMSVHDTAEHPRLAAELAWLREALAAQLPLLGVCLGAQLLACAIGGRVVAGTAKEIGVAPVELLDADDPLLGPLAPSAPVLHWHGELIELPAGVAPLARSAPTAVQAFRAGEHAWGLLFHAEADGELVEQWLAEPSMANEARAALGPGHASLLREGAAALEPQRGARVFAAFAERCRSPRR